MIVVESLHHINVPCTDLKGTVDFYTMFLDFDLIEQTESQALVRFDNTTLKLNQGQPVNGQIPVISFMLDVDDFTDALQEIENEGIKIVTGPVETKSGEAVTIQDPSGNLLELFYEE